MKLQKIAYSAIIAAIYAVLTLALAPASFGPVQCRISEALCVLPMLSAAAVPGLAVGCLIANLFMGSVYDIVFGTLATLFAAILTRVFRKNKWVAMAFPVLLNAVIVGGYIGLFLDKSAAVWFFMLTVGAGQLVACYGFGLPIYAVLKKRIKE